MIHEMRIQNFKSIRNVTVEFTPVTVLIGRSGTGKSNFIEAIRYLRDLLGADWNGMGGGVAGMGSGVLSSVETIRPLPKTNAPTRFEIFFSVRSEKKKFR